MLFKRLSMKNFMSIGHEVVELNFAAYSESNIVVISGINRDISEISSNGAGKSLLQEAIVYSLFDKTIRGIGKEECINNVNQKGLVVELYVDDLKIQRSRKPNKFRLWQDPTGLFSDSTEISESTVALTQKRLEQEICLNYETFINTTCFGQHNTYKFLGSTKETRRLIIENLLQLEDFNLYEKQSREYLRKLKSLVEEVYREYEFYVAQVKKKQLNLDETNALAAKHTQKIQDKIVQTQASIATIQNTDYGSILEKWTQYETARQLLTQKKEEMFKLDVGFSETSKKYTDLKNRIQVKNAPLVAEIKRIDAELVKIKSLKPGVKCPNCLQEIDPANYEAVSKELNERREELAGEAGKTYETLQEVTKAEKDETLAFKKVRDEVSKEIRELSTLREPVVSKEVAIKNTMLVEELEKSLVELTEQLNDNPYKDILQKVQKEIEHLAVKKLEVEVDLKAKKSLLPYYEYWTKGFGDTGIKSFVIEQIISVLNKQINYWLQFLIDNNIIVNFNKFLEVEIKRPGELGTFLYEQASGGEKKRIDLAITLAFAYIMKLRSNIDNNILFLDELAESIDSDGVEGIYKALVELSKNKLVFLITHRTDLLNKLEGRPKILVVKQNGFTKIVAGN